MRDEENIWTRERRGEKDGVMVTEWCQCRVRGCVWGGWRSDLGRWRGVEGEWNGSVGVEVTGVAQDRGAHLLVVGRAVSWRDEEGVKNKKRGERDRGEREKKGSKNKVSIHKEM